MYKVPKYNGAAIKAARMNQRFNVRMLARRAGVADSTVHRLERLGQGHIETVGAILDVLSMKLEDVLLSRPELTDIPAPMTPLAEHQLVESIKKETRSRIAG